jgi:formylglycine-generating enzyme required for sulfatase activity
MMADKSRGRKRERDSAALTRLFPDHPVRDGSVAFEFGGIARTLAELALNPSNATPFTVVVKGEWGRGKTTLLEETRRILNEEGSDARAKASGQRRVRTLWFNAWKYPKEDTVLAGLLGALLDEFRRGNLLEQLKGMLERHKEWLAQRVLRTAFPWLFGGEGPKDRFEGVEEKRAFHDHFWELFNQVAYVWFHGWATGRDTFGKTLQEDSRNAVVALFLDDLDRCREERVLEVLEAINLFLDLPGVCFYLGLDWQQLLRLLEKRPGGEQELFLEKIVQVAVDLPEVTPEGAEQFLTRIMRESRFVEMLGGEIRTIAQVLSSRNPRHVKRCLNDLSIRLGVLKNTGNLGGGERQIPAEAVISWHLLHEFLPPEISRNYTRQIGHLEGLLNRYEAFKEESSGEEPSKPEDLEPVLFDLFRHEKMRSHMDRLAGLSQVQRNLLVHLGSTPLAEAATAARVARPKEVGAVGIRWASIAGGEFLMGSLDGQEDESPVHKVRLSPYSITVHPVTNAQYATYLSETGARSPRHWEGGKNPEGEKNHPVVMVTWRDAAAYCKWLGDKTGDTVDLPTEAQWEFAARGPDGRTYPWGEEAPNEKFANFDGRVGDTMPVGSYPKGATPEGVHDMAGNVWEWCRDWYGRYAEGEEVDPAGPERGHGRVLRGGAFSNSSSLLRAACRYNYLPAHEYEIFGFRCVRAARGESE